MKTGWLGKFENLGWEVVTEKSEQRDHKLNEFAHKDLNHSFFNFACTYVLFPLLEKSIFLFRMLLDSVSFISSISVRDLLFLFHRGKSVSNSVSSIPFLLHFLCFSEQILFQNDDFCFKNAFFCFNCVSSICSKLYV